MNVNLVSIILTLIIGIFVGAIFILIMDFVKGNNAEKKAEKLLADARREKEK